MKTIGMIGGMSWESTSHYYQVMNRYIHVKLGKHHSLEAILYSVDFERILQLVSRDDWQAIGEEIALLSKKLEKGGADLLLLTSNAIHKVFAQVERAIEIPILHIADPTGRAIRQAGIGKIGLLGTKVTMEEAFYIDRLKQHYTLEVRVPEKEDRELIHKVIFDELTLGIVRDASREKFLQIIDKLAKRGAGGVILGCTELTLLIQQSDTHVSLFDTTDLHAKAAVDAVL
jgi:aspartate racemase